MLRDIGSTNTLCDSILISWNIIIIGGTYYELHGENGKGT